MTPLRRSVRAFLLGLAPLLVATAPALGDVLAYQITPLGTLGGDSSYAFGINDSGQVAGYSSTAAGYQQAFLYTPGSAMTGLGTFGGNYSYAQGINDSGQVVGHASTAAGERAFLYTPGSGMTSLGTLGVGSSGTYGINSAGQVVGNSGGSGFLYSDGVMKNLNSLVDPASGWTIFEARGVNDRGLIAATGRHATYGTQALLLAPVAAVPEPSSFLIAAAGGVGIVAARRRSARRKAATPSA